MDLDNFAMTLGEDGKWRHAPDEPFEGLRLCDGWGTSMIRGKVYADVVEAATGQSLYQERIEPATVVEMAGRFRAAVEQAKQAGERVGEREMFDERGEMQRVRFPLLEVAGCEIHAGEAEDLARWLEICAEHGYAIDSWW
jgi:hypothetical protein